MKWLLPNSFGDIMFDEIALVEGKSWNMYPYQMTSENTIPHSHNVIEIVTLAYFYIDYNWEKTSLYIGVFI